MNYNQELLKTLVNTNAISGHEDAIKAIIKYELKDFNLDYTTDKLGSQIYTTKSEGPTIMLAAHMDEVGFIVKYIDDNGFIFFMPVGGWWNQVMLAQKVRITTITGATYEGVIGSKPPHVLSPEERKKPVDIDEMFIDLGVYSKEEVESLGIKPGDMICPVGDFQSMTNEDFVLAKAFDNRIGCYIVIEVLKRLATKNLHCQVAGVFTVQEEIGLRGATTSSNIVNPDIALAVDTGIAGDTPKMTNKESMSKLGDGPQIMVMDGTTFGHVNLREFMLNIAKKNDIKVQLDFIPGGGTDAGKMHLAHDGALGMSIAIATRYIHSHLSVININDVNMLIDLLVEFCCAVDEDNFKTMKGCYE